MIEFVNVFFFFLKRRRQEKKNWKSSHSPFFYFPTWQMLYTFNLTQTDLFSGGKGNVLCFVFSVLTLSLTGPRSLLLKQLLLIRVQSEALKRMEGWWRGYGGINDTNSFSLFFPPFLFLFPLT